jgi:hypothetical protein
MYATSTTTDREHLADLICRAILASQERRENPTKAAEEAAKAFAAGLAATPASTAEKEHVTGEDVMRDWYDFYYDTLAIPPGLLRAMERSAAPESPSPSSPSSEASPACRPSSAGTLPKDWLAMHALLQLIRLKRRVERAIRELGESQ